MTSILKSCKPRPDLVAGSFNPEIFTASLRQVVGNYRGDVSVKTAYTDAEVFFREATSTTHGMRQVADHVMRRLGGDNMVPFLTRLETGFGGGKTHTLIARAHLAHRGTEIADLVKQVGIVDPKYLLAPGAIKVAGKLFFPTWFKDEFQVTHSIATNVSIQPARAVDSTQVKTPDRGLGCNRLVRPSWALVCGVQVPCAR